MADRALRVALVSLGCPKNLVDSEKMLACLAEEGLLVNAPMDEADVVVVNTCGFLSAARDESLEIIREALERKRQGDVRRVVVAGCLVNRDADRLFELAPGIDAIVGVHDREAILSAVTGAGPRTLRSAFAGGPAASDAGRFRLTPPHTAYLRVSEGCSQKCTFCTIPSIRGPLRSKLPDDVLAEARELVNDGAVELNVIGQDTTAYGADLGGRDRPSLAGLLRELDRLDGLQWIRLLYTYPRRFTDDLIDSIADCESVVPYVDMPLQHIATSVLKRMGRGVTREDTEALLEKLRRRIPGLVLRTTLIVGFPGETDRQFEDLLDFVRTFRFDALGVFGFSPEEGTAAATMEGQVDEATIAERVEKIMLAQQEIAFAASADRVGASVEILVDGIDPEGYCLGRTYGQAPDVDSVCILTEPRDSGQFIRAAVRDWHEYDLIVEPT